MLAFYHIYMRLAYVTSPSLLVYLLYRLVLARRSKPAIAEADIVYQEWFASGHSEANLLTILGGARNCIRLIVTAEYLIVTSWFPFSLFSTVYDMEHVITLKAISSVEQKRTFGVDFLLLVYQDNQGRSHKIGLIPKDQQDFLEAIGQDIGLTV